MYTERYLCKSILSVASVQQDPLSKTPATDEVGALFQPLRNNQICIQSVQHTPNLRYRRPAAAFTRHQHPHSVALNLQRQA